MRSLRVSHWLSGLAVFAVAAVTAYSCGVYGQPLPSSIKLPGQITSGVIRGTHFYAITVNGHLIAVDLRKHQMKDFGTFDVKLSSALDVADGKAYVSSQNRVYRVDLTSGKIVHAMVCDVEPGIRKLGYLGADRLFVQGRSGTVVSLASGKRLEMLDQIKTGKSVRIEACDDGQCATRAFAFIDADQEKTELALFDMEKGKVIDRIPTAYLRSYRQSEGQYHIVGDKAYVVTALYGYGVRYSTSFGYVDLKTHKYHALPFPMKGDSHTTLVSGPNGSLILAGQGEAFQYDADGKLAGTVLTKIAGTVVGVWNRQALVASNATLEFLPLQQPTIKK